MIAILFNWLYIFFTTFCLGQAFSFFSEKKLHYRLKRLDSILLAGLVMATVYAQVFSLFYKVGLVANGCLLAFCLLVLICLRRRIGGEVRRLFTESTKTGRIAVLVLALLWTYFTSRGYLLYDSDLYHAQSIRWIEEYGIVKGLGNLHVRFAYNSSSFALSALYSMKFLLGRSLHGLSGFFALLLSGTVMDIAKVFRRKRMLLSDYARAAAIYYLTTICDEVVSPSSDYVVMIVLFFLIIKWLTLLEQKEDPGVAPYALLCVAGAYAVSLKLTAGLILLLVLKPAVVLLKEKRWKEIAVYLVLGMVVVAPWMIRTVVISGWLLYPFPQLDLFNVDWKISAEKAAVDAAEIKTWGRALYDASLVDMPVTQWFPGWFSSTLPATGKLLVLADIACIPVFVAMAVVTFLKKKWQNLDYLLVLSAVLCSYLFWQFSAPLLRYGYAYVLLLVVLTAGWLLERGKAARVLYVLLLCYAAYKLCMLAGYIGTTWREPRYFWQSGYGSYELEAYEINGETFYYPLSGDRTGYDFFPAAPTRAEIQFRGETIQEGFRQK